MITKSTDNQHRDFPLFLLLLAILAGSALLYGCQTKQEEQGRQMRVGFVNPVGTLEPIFEGIKKGLREGGFEEGKNIVYIKNGPIHGMDKIENELNRLIKEKVDLIICMTTTTCIAAKSAVEQSNTPVLFGVVSDPIRSGLANSVKEPGGNLTGVTSGNTLPMGMEWLIKIAPNIKRVFAPFNPADESNTVQIAGLRSAAANLGLELVTPEVTDHERAVKILSEIPADIDALVEIPSAFFGRHVKEFVQASNSNKIPLLGANRHWVKAGATLGFNFDNQAIGEQMGRIGSKILRGSNPAKIPFETPDKYLYLSIKSANHLGLKIPQAILKQALYIAR